MIDSDGNPDLPANTQKFTVVSAWAANRWSWSKMCEHCMAWTRKSAGREHVVHICELRPCRSSTATKVEGLSQLNEFYL